MSIGCVEVMEKKERKPHLPLTANEALEAFREWQTNLHTISITCAPSRHPTQDKLPDLNGVITKEGFRMECPECGYQRILLPAYIAQKAIDKRDDT